MKKWMFLVTIFTTVLLVAACSGGVNENAQGYNVEEASNNDQENEQETASLQLLDNEKVGQYLADSKGMSLYYFTKDQPGKSNCSGDCLANWPPFVAQEFEVPEGFNKDDFGTIKREDTGEEQVTFKGYPLYYFVNDKAEGDVTGQGINNVWFIVNTETPL